MTCCGSKNDFCKKSGDLLLALKCKTTPVLAKSAELAQNSKKYLRRLLQKKRADMHIPGGLLFMWGVFPSFRFRVLVAASQKTRFRYSENGKSTFRGTKQKSASMAFLAIPRATRMSDMASF
jgi:hypothetical protein